MNAALNGLGRDLFGWFGQLSFELGVLALVVLAVNRLLPIKSPALRHLLWVVVLLKPVVAVAVSSPYTLFTPLNLLVPLAESGREALAFLPVEPPVHAAAFPIVATSSVGLTAAGWGAILWMAGAALLIGRILIGYGILWRLRRQAQVQHGGPLFDALRQARREFDCYPRAEVATSSSTGSPIALGILRPLIVFPADFVDKLRADELSLILMHEMAHVRRCDNLVLLLHRLISAVLFFHPAVWLCGRMLRREAEQACDDLVVCTTGREKAYARGLAQVAERGARFNPLVRKIPTMNAFAAAESDLALRVRRTLGDGARRMGTLERVLAAVLLCPLMVVTLPSCGTTGKRTGGNPGVAKIERDTNRVDLFVVVDHNGNMTLDEDKPVTFATLKEELQAQRQLADNDTTIIIQIQGEERVTRNQIVQIIDIARQVGVVNHVIATEPQTETGAAAKKSEDNKIIQELKTREKEKTWEQAEVTDPDKWSEELKAQLLKFNPDRTIEEIAKEIRKRRLWQKVLETAAMTDPDEWSDELKTQLLARWPDNTIEEIAKRVHKRQGTAAQYIVQEIAALYIVLDNHGNMRLNKESVTFATLKEELQAKRQLHDNTARIVIVTQGDEDAAREQIVQIMEIARQVGLVDQVIATEPQTETSAAARKGEDNRNIQELKTGERIWAQAVLTDPKDWSEELEAQLLALNPDNTIEEIAEEINGRRLLRKFLEIAEKDPDQWKWAHKLKEQLPDSTITIEEIAKIRRRLQKRARIERVQGGQR